MKEVTIKSKVVSRDGTGKPATGGGSQGAVDLSAYLLKQIWDSAFEVKEKDGVQYLFGKIPLVLQYGLTFFADEGLVDLPNLYDGIPIDNQTLYWEETTDDEGNVVRLLKAKGGSGGGSVQFPLTWSGYASGSWNGSEAKNIQIPSKLSELDNDGINSDLTVRGKITATNNVKLYGQEQDDIEFVFNPNGSITNIESGGVIAIRHALKFNWYDDSYEIGAVRGGGVESKGFGVTYGNHTLIFNLGVDYCDFHTLVTLRRGLYLEGKSNLTGETEIGKNIILKGSTGSDDIRSVYNEDGAIDNNTYSYESIRHALRFQWYDDAYEIGAVRTDHGEAYGFGVTYNNNQLVWKVNKTQMDVYGDLCIKGERIRYDSDAENFVMEGDLKLQKAGSYYGTSLFFGDGSFCYLKEDRDDHLTVYGGNGIDLTMGTSYYLNVTAKGIKVNGKYLTYNSSSGYWELEGDLLVTGGITSYE